MPESTRRSFLAALVALPVVGKLFGAKPAGLVTPVEPFNGWILPKTGGVAGYTEIVTPNVELVTGLQRMGERLYIFTPSATFYVEDGDAFNFVMRRA